MITKMLLEIFQAIAEEPAVKRLLGVFDLNKKKDIDLETLMNELNLNEQERRKFQEAYKDYYQGKDFDPYKYKYEPKSSDPFDKFDAYYQKYEDQAKEAEEKYGEGAGNYSHRKYQKYREEYAKQRYGSHQQSNSKQSYQTNYSTSEDKKHYKTLDLKPGASFEEIKQAYKNAMKKYHPDRFQSDSQKKYAEDLSSKINVAYDFFKKKFGKN